MIANNELTAIFLCATQGGMRRSSRTNTLVLVSDHTKPLYEDRWVSDDTIHFTGIGRTGDQRLDFLQNNTLAQSASNGVTPYLFEVYEKGSYLFRGPIALRGDPYQEIQPDNNDQLRKVWIFPLSVIGEGIGYTVPKDLINKKQKTKERIAKRLSDKELYTRAVQSRKHPINRNVASTTYEQNVYIAELAKRRANGICQLCDRPAPFLDKTGEPFLEAHHILWLSKGGEDTIENAAALCPNCHKKMHVLNLKADRKKLFAEAKKTCCQLTLTGGSVFV